MGPDAAVDLAYPFEGCWLVRNSPADRVPSHGTEQFASSYAIDFVPVDARGRTAPVTVGTLVRPEPVARFPGFGRVLRAPLTGVVIAAEDAQPDHPAYRGLPSIGYAVTQARRVRGGWAALAGNHVLVESGPFVVALCHLQQGSVRVERGQSVRPGDELGRCGNSGNSTEPHLHLQVIDDPDIGRAHPVRFTVGGSLPRNGDVVDAGSSPETRGGAAAGR